MADSTMATQPTLLALAVLSTVGVAAMTTGFTLAVRTPDPFIGAVAAWAFRAIAAELGSPDGLQNPKRFNPSTWNPVILQGLQQAASWVSMVCLAMAVLAVVLRVVAMFRGDSSSEGLKRRFVADGAAGTA